jgi:FkbM family methyltransferase
MRAKDRIANTLKWPARNAGKLLAYMLRPLPSTWRAACIVGLRYGTVHTPRTLYFLMYEFAWGFARYALLGTEEPYLVTVNHEHMQMEYDLTQTTQKQLYLSTVHEPHVSACVATLKTGDCFIDVGSNVGYFALMAAPLVGPQGVVVAIEPEPRNLMRLRRNMALNPDVHITLLPIAVSSVAGTATLKINPLNEGGHSLGDFLDTETRTARAQHAEDISVVTDTLDAVVLPLLKPGRRALFKIDVEGFELEVLKGMQEILSTRDVEIICEVSAQKREQFEYLSNFGYHVFSMTNGQEVTPTTDTRKRDYLFRKP